MLKSSIIVFFVTLVFSVCVNELNLREIRKNNPENDLLKNRTLVHNSTIYNVDNIWYLNQFKNYLSGNGFTADPGKPYYEVRRTPVYPLFYGLHYYFFGEERSYFYIRYTQSLIFALSTVALILALFYFTGNKTISWLSFALYGLNPVIFVTTYCTTTESLSIEMVCFCLFFLSLCKEKGKKIHWFLCGVFFALALLTRPSILFSSLAFLAGLIMYNRRSFSAFLWNGAIFTAGVLLLILPWTIRNYIVTKGDFVPLEKIYGDPMDYGAPNLELSAWISCWSNPAATGNSSEKMSNVMMENLTRPDTISRQQLLDRFMEKFPDRAFIGNTETVVRDAILGVYNYYESKTTEQPAVVIKQKEEESMRKLKKLKENFIKASPLDYYVVTPLLIFKSIVFQSNTSHLAILDHYKENVLQWLTKTMVYLINCIGWIALFLFPLYKKYRDYYRLSLLFIFPSILFIILFYRYFEARYYYPLWSVLMGIEAIMIAEIGRRIRGIKHKS